MGHQGERFDLGFILLEQLSRQTGGPVGVVSDGAVHDLNLHQHIYLQVSKIG